MDVPRVVVTNIIGWSAIQIIALSHLICCSMLAHPFILIRKSRKDIRPVKNALPPFIRFHDGGTHCDSGAAVGTKRIRFRKHNTRPKRSV